MDVDPAVDRSESGGSAVLRDITIKDGQTVRYSDANSQSEAKIKKSTINLAPNASCAISSNPFQENDYKSSLIKLVTRLQEQVVRSLQTSLGEGQISESEKIVV